MRLTIPPTITGIDWSPPLTQERPPSATINGVYALLANEYGVPENRNPASPLDELVAAILSQNTSDGNSRRAFASLRTAFKTWAEVAAAPVGDVADAIRSGGLADQKAPRIKSVLRAVLDGPMGGDLSQLAGWDIHDARTYLTSLSGVGVKTAACVLLFSLGSAAFPVDTHVHRVVRRLGLVPMSATATKTQEHLESMVPGSRMYPYHINLIRHGRQVCRARRPACARCNLQPVCAFYSREVAPTEGQ